MTGSTQFEGRTAEEAVARARAALGETGALRCWKTRRGGVGGFFAKEVFVASLTPPPGSETPRGPAARAGSRSGDKIPLSEAPIACDPEQRREPDDPGDLLSGLVEATSDEVSVRSWAIPAAAFDQVLAEAEAALSQTPGVVPAAEPRPPAAAASPEAALGDEREEIQTGATPTGAEDGEIPPQVAKPPGLPGDRARRRPRTKVDDATKARSGSATPRSRGAAPTKAPARGRAAVLPDLRPGLRGIGVPDAYLPRGQRPSLDLLANVMATLPPPPPLPSHPGAVLVVVGAGSLLRRTVDLVRAQLALEAREVLSTDGMAAPAGAIGEDRRGAMGLRLTRQIARRRASARTSLLAVEGRPGASLGQDARAVLQRAQPDYVLAAVGAGSKRVDVEHWVGELPAVDALAIWDLAGTHTPGELLGLLPIAFVDGEASSVVGWTLALAGRALACRP
jgi:hypothetical protein